MARILLVEDDQDSRDLVKILLEGEGYEVATATTGEQALEAARATTIDLILMDVSLPGEMDGLAVTRRLREDSTFDGVPILALTAHALRGDRERMTLAGCDEHVTKPLDDLAIFVETIRSFLLGGRTPMR